MIDDAWTSSAACRDFEPRLWWPEKGQTGGEAKAVCARCPVARPCLEAAVARRETEGVWAGAGGQALRALRRAWASRVVNPDGWELAVTTHFARLVDGHASGAVDVNGPAATHGLEATYAKGCRCPACSLAVADRGRRLAAVVDPPERVVELATARAVRPLWEAA